MILCHNSCYELCHETCHAVKFVDQLAEGRIGGSWHHVGPTACTAHSVKLKDGRHTGMQAHLYLWRSGDGL